MSHETASPKVGLYVDVANISRNGGQGMRHDVLRDFACRCGGDGVRLNVYSSYDTRRADEDARYREGRNAFHSTLRDQGYKVIEKAVKWFEDEDGNKVSKSNIDLDLAVDALLQSDKLDRIVLATGDGDFVQVVRALQNKGCRVEVVAFENVSGDLRREADLFISGYLIPNLKPVDVSLQRERWGDVGSYVRGVCRGFDISKGYGFLHFLTELDSPLWRVDTRHPASPYKSAFIHRSEIPEDLDLCDLPSRNIIFQFRLEENPQDRGKLQAKNVSWMNPYGA